jgi:hypothetical protein
MVRVSSHSTVWYRDIPHKQLHYEGLVLNWPIFDSNKECLNMLKRQCIDVDKSVKEKYDNTFAFYNSARNSFNP